MFEGFTDERIDVGEVELRVRHSPPGGPPVVLLHGHPRTSATWHRVAPVLRSAGHTVVCPDLRGYGRSDAPPTTPDHGPYAKRAMATDIHTVMRRLGHERFAVVGHDRGSYVALRLALDRPDAVTALAILDGIPIVEHLERCDDRFAAAYWHWFFFAQPGKPERAILADPDAWYGGDPEAMGAEAYAEFRRPSTIPRRSRRCWRTTARASAIDRAHEEADRASGRRVECPLLVLWSRHDDLEELHGDPLAIWRDWASDLRGGHDIDSGHHMAEEAPLELASALVRFLATR